MNRKQAAPSRQSVRGWPDRFAGLTCSKSNRVVHNFKCSGRSPQRCTCPCQESFMVETIGVSFGVELYLT
jgi:hypothetical protein